MVEKHDNEKDWECQDCGNSLESKVEPKKCPCGSEKIKAQQQLSMMEQMMKDKLNKDNKGKS